MVNRPVCMVAFLVTSENDFQGPSFRSSLGWVPPSRPVLRIRFVSATAAARAGLGDSGDCCALALMALLPARTTPRIHRGEWDTATPVGYSLLAYWLLAIRCGYPLPVISRRLCAGEGQVG